jgi:nitroreductase
MNLTELVSKNRSYRRFYEEIPIARETLRDLVNLARLSASASNRQPLKFILVCDRESNARLFPYLSWAGFLKDWPGPAEGERPAAYIIILGDQEISQVINCDHGIAAQSILLGATERGLGGCIIGSFKPAALAELFAIPGRYRVMLVIALGKPAERVEIEPLKGDDYRYWRDKNSVHHVPKRSLDELILDLSAAESP